MPRRYSAPRFADRSQWMVSWTRTAGWSERARSEGGDSEAGYASTVSTDATVSGKTSEEEDDAGDGSAVSTQLGEPDDVRRCAIRILDWT